MANAAWTCWLTARRSWPRDSRPGMTDPDDAAQSGFVAVKMTNLRSLAMVSPLPKRCLSLLW